MSLHFTIANNTAVANSPAFFGTNPAEVRVEGPKKGLRVLGSMEDAARALLATLDDSQRASAIYEKVAPSDILTKNNPTFEALVWRRRRRELQAGAARPADEAHRDLHRADG